MGTWEEDDHLILEIIERQRQRKNDLDISLQAVKDENEVLRTESQYLKRTVNEKDNQLEDLREQRDKAVEELDRLRKQVTILETSNIPLSNEKLRLERILKIWKHKYFFHIAEKARITKQAKKDQEDLQHLKKSLETKVSENMVLSSKMDSVQRQANEEKNILILRCEKAESDAKNAKTLQLEAEEKARQIEKESEEREEYAREWQKVQEREYEIFKKMFPSRREKGMDG